MSTVYNQFSSEYNELFIRSIQEFIATHREQKLEADYFNTFYPSFGIKPSEKCDFLIIGQAPKGWRSGFATGDDNIQEKLIAEAIESSNCYCGVHDHNPIDWVNVYWTKSLFEEHILDKAKADFYEKGKYFAFRSFFWNVTYKLIADYYGFDRNAWDWSKKVVWSNLYKIAPEDANPTEFQKSTQLNIAVELIKKEIEELQPKFCIVLTNESWWTPFQMKIGSEKLFINSNLTEIVSHEKYMGTQIIVTKRPFRGNGESHVKQILELIK